MTIKELKSIIESNKVPENLVIMKYTDNDFVPNQYINYIKTNYSVESVEDYSECFTDSADIFSVGTQDDTVRVLRTDTFDCVDERFKNSKRTFVVCKKLSKQSQSIFGDFVVDIPKLEQWQINDYAVSIASGVGQESINRLLSVCGNNIYRLDQELQKLSIFPEAQRQFMFDKFIGDGAFNDLSTYNIFDITSCIIKRDTKKLFHIYRELDNIDVEPFGLLVLLCQNFKDIIDVQLSVNPTAESLGMKSNKFWAVKHSCGYYNRNELISIYSFLTSIDKKIKIGELSTDHLVDYIITKIISV